MIHFGRISERLIIYTNQYSFGLFKMFINCVLVFIATYIINDMCCATYHKFQQSIMIDQLFFRVLHIVANQLLTTRLELAPATYFSVFGKRNLIYLCVFIQEPKNMSNNYGYSYSNPFKLAMVRLKQSLVLLPNLSRLSSKQDGSLDSLPSVLQDSVHHFSR